MHDLAQAVLLGVGVGSLVVAIALSVVVTHRGSGVVNFAAAALAMYAAYVDDGLRRDGQLVLPPLPNPLAPVEGVAHVLGASGVDLPDWPTSISFGRPLLFLPSLLV